MPETFAAEIHLLPAERGGRVGPLVHGEWRTVLGINNEHLSARLLFDEAPAPGDSFRATVQLLVPEAIHHFPVGAEFTVWESGAKGAVHVLPSAL